MTNCEKMTAAGVSFFTRCISTLSLRKKFVYYSVPVRP